MMTELVQIITGFIGAFGFAILYNIRGKKLFVAAIGGLLSWSLFVVLNFLFGNEVLGYFIVSMLVSFYAEIMARLLRTPTTTFITTALIPLVPGRALYYTMANAFDGKMDKFFENGLHTLQLAGALALGIAVATATARIIHKLIEKKHYDKVN